MSRWHGWALYAAGLAVAAAVALAAGVEERSNSPVASVENASGAGTRALFVYLRESGFDVAAVHTPLTDLAPTTRTLVLSAPTARRISREETDALQRFAEAGGTVVVLAPPTLVTAQPELAAWLELEAPEENTPMPALGTLTGPDAFGLSVPVDHREGPFSGVASLRVGRSDRLGLRLGRRTALPVAAFGDAPVLWWLPTGQGELIVTLPDIAENRRIELEDNLAFWVALASRGPLHFDEFHHVPEDGPPRSLGLVAFSVQLLAFFAFFAVARGTRLGPARPELVERHRSTREYLDAFAWLTRRARVEGELLREAHARLRVLLQERLGIATTLPDDEVALALERQCQVPREEYLTAVRELRASASAGQVRPGEFARLSRSLARIERVVRGRVD
ncbi:MAG: DUF4350 domain-containing protein [Myxococcaceae bacterium]